MDTRVSEARKRAPRACLAVRVFSALVLVAAGWAAAPLLTPEQQARALKLENELLAPCCYSEPVARHNSSAASEMRAEIASMIAGGKTDREIVDFYVARYGQRILVEPEGAKWWWMHVVPVVILVLGLVWVVWLLVKWTRSAPAAPPAS
jgi:cytochrome c-type biogenesis protein CcmH